LSFRNEIEDIGCYENFGKNIYTHYKEFES